MYVVYNIALLRSASTSTREVLAYVSVVAARLQSKKMINSRPRSESVSEASARASRRWGITKAKAIEGAHLINSICSVVWLLGRSQSVLPTRLRGGSRGSASGPVGASASAAASATVTPTCGC